MRTAIVLPFRLDGVSLCDDGTCALFSRARQNVSEWVMTTSPANSKKSRFFPGKNPEFTPRLTSEICVWKMAERAPVVVCMDDSGAVFVLTPPGFRRLGNYVAARIVKVSPDGKAVLLQMRGDMILAGRIPEKYCGRRFAGATAPILTTAASSPSSRGKVSYRRIEEPQVLATAATSPGHGIPLDIRLSAMTKGFYCVHAEKRNFSAHHCAHMEDP